MKESKELKRMFADTNDYKASRKAYYKEWRKKQSDKVRKHNETFWKKQAEKPNNKGK